MARDRGCDLPFGGSEHSAFSPCGGALLGVLENKDRLMRIFWRHDSSTRPQERAINPVDTSRTLSKQAVSIIRGCGAIATLE